MQLVGNFAAGFPFSSTPKDLALAFAERIGAAVPGFEGKVWIDKLEYQWVRIEAETTGVISYGLFLARMNPGAKLLFEQTRINDEIWLPKYEQVSGSGRLGLVKKIAIQQDLTWSNYRKFQVESKIVSTQ